MCVCGIESELVYVCVCVFEQANSNSMRAQKSILVCEFVIGFPQKPAVIGPLVSQIYKNERFEY